MSRNPMTIIIFWLLIIGALYPIPTAAQTPPRSVFHTPTLAFQEVKSDSMSDQRDDSLYGTAKRSVGHLLSDFWYVASSPARIDTEGLLWVGGIAAVGGTIYAYDTEIYDALHRNKNETAVKFLIDTGHDVESMGIIPHMDVLCLAGYASGSLLKIEPMRDASVQTFESLLLAALYKNIFRDLVGRTRPRNGQGARNFEPFEGKSFPSGHASNAFQVATIVSHHADFWPVSILMYGLATTVAIQRIDTDAHWPADVFFGAAYGTAVARTIIKLNENRQIDLQPDINPDQAALGLKLTYNF